LTQTGGQAAYLRRSESRRGLEASGWDSANLTEKLLCELPSLRVVDLEGLLGSLNQRPSDSAYAEGWRELAELADLSGEGFRNHALDGT
jgi:hypothetical protein